MPPMPRRIAALLALAALGATAGCGSGAHPAARALSPRQEITLAAHQARQVDSFGSTLSVTMSGRLR